MNNRIHKHAPNCTYLWCIVALVPLDIQSHFRDLLNLTVADSTISIGSLHIPKELIDFLFLLQNSLQRAFKVAFPLTVTGLTKQDNWSVSTKVRPYTPTDVQSSTRELHRLLTKPVSVGGSVALRLQSAPAQPSSQTHAAESRRHRIF